MDGQKSSWHWLVSASIITLFALFLNISALPIALPVIQRDLDLSQIQVHWVLNIFWLCLALFAIPMQIAANRFGQRLLLLFGLSVVIAGSLLAATAHHVALLWLGQGLQGAGCSGLLPLCIAELRQKDP